MNIPLNLARILTKRGHFVSVRISRPVKLRKGIDRNIVKTTVGVFRAGLDYDEQKRVKTKRETGQLPATPQPLPWGEWLVFPFFIQHKGKLYVRLYPLGKVQVFYFEDSKPIQKSELESIALASELKPSERPDCITVGAENIAKLV